MGPRARGLSWPRAPCGRRERPGPAQGGGARRPRAPGAVAATRKPATWVGRSRGGKLRDGREALEAPPVPAGASRGPRVRAAAQRVFTFPLVERQCRHLSASTRHFRRRGSGSGSGVGVGLSHARGAPRSGWPSRRAPPREDPAAPALWPRALPDVAFLAVGAGNTWLCSSRCAAVPAHLQEQWARGTAVRPLSTS